MAAAGATRTFHRATGGRPAAIGPRIFHSILPGAEGTTAADSAVYDGREFDLVVDRRLDGPSHRVQPVRRPPGESIGRRHASLMRLVPGRGDCIRPSPLHNALGPMSSYRNKAAERGYRSLLSVQSCPIAPCCRCCFCLLMMCQCSLNSDQ